MTEFNTEFCDTCPSRGLCVGKVALDVKPISYGEGDKSFPGFELVATDEDGVTSLVQRVTPESHVVSTRKGDKVVETYSKDAVSSEVIFTALQNNPEAYKDLIKERAKKCLAPCSIEHSSGYAITYRKVCRATAISALEALAEKTTNSPKG